MDVRDLTAEQREKLIAFIAGPAGELYRLRKRMEERDWYDDDPVFTAISAAYLATRAAITTLILSERLPAPAPPPPPPSPGAQHPVHARLTPAEPHEYKARRRAKRRG